MLNSLLNLLTGQIDPEAKLKENIQAIEESQVLSDSEILEIYTKLDTVGAELQQRAYAALVKHADKKYQEVDPILLTTLPTEKKFRFVSAQGYVFDISDSAGIASWVIVSPTNPINRQPFATIELKNMLQQILTNENEVLPAESASWTKDQIIAQYEQYVLYANPKQKVLDLFAELTIAAEPKSLEACIAKYPKIQLREQAKNLPRYIPLIKSIQKYGDKQLMKELGLDVVRLYCIFAQSNVNGNRAFFVGGRSIWDLEIDAKSIVKKMHKYWACKKPAAQELVDFVQFNMLCLLQCDTDLLSSLLDWERTEEIFAYITFAELKNLNPTQVEAIIDLLNDYGYGRLGYERLISLLGNLDQAKTEGEPAISLVKLLQMNIKVLKAMCGYAFDNRESYFKYGFYDIDGLIANRLLNVDDLIRLSAYSPAVCNYELQVKKYILAKGYTHTDLADITELLQELRVAVTSANAGDIEACNKLTDKLKQISTPKSESNIDQTKECVPKLDAAMLATSAVSQKLTPT